MGVEFPSSVRAVSAAQMDSVVKIDARLFLGGAVVAEQEKALQRMGVTHVLALGEGLLNHPFKVKLYNIYFFIKSSWFKSFDRRRTHSRIKEFVLFQALSNSGSGN